MVGEGSNLGDDVVVAAAAVAVVVGDGGVWD